MTEAPEKIVFTIAEMLKWAHDETELADTLELFGESMPDAPEEAATARRRSRWLDQQVAYTLDAMERGSRPHP
jgi:hypothetical protein